MGFTPACSIRAQQQDQRGPPTVYKESLAWMRMQLTTPEDGAKQGVAYVIAILDLYRIRRLLRRGAERHTERSWARLVAGSDAATASMSSWPRPGSPRKNCARSIGRRTGLAPKFTSTAGCPTAPRPRCVAAARMATGRPAARCNYRRGRLTTCGPIGAGRKLHEIVRPESLRTVSALR